MNLCKKVTDGHETMPHKCDTHPIPDDWIKENCLNFHYTDEQILGAAQPTVVDDYLCGIYFLISEERIMYVGQSKQISFRIDQHRDAGKVFDAVSWFEAPPLFLNAIEAYYIARIDPPLNNKWQPAYGFCNYVTAKLQLEVA